MKRQTSMQCDTGPQSARRRHARPARKCLRWVAGWSLASALLVPIADCREAVIAPNLVAGIRDGLVTGTSGIIEDFFNSFFGLNGGDDEESGAGEFAGI